MTTEREDLKEIGQRLVAVRKHLHMLQKEFALELGISNASLSEIESGNNKPRFELLFNLARKYRVNLYYLFFGHGAMFLPLDAGTTVKEKNYGPETEEWLKQFLHYFNESEMLRYAMMSYFSKYLTENRRSIELEIKGARGRKEDDLD